MIELGPADLHVWTVRLSGADPRRRYGDAFSDGELARAARFARAQDRDAFLHARGALRTLLARYLGATARSIALASGAWGKPELAGGALSFNLTHAGGLALIAIARGRRVGIDLETVRAMPEALAIARTMFASPVAALLAGLDAPERDRAFLRFWTAKEACIKALGLALAMSSDAVRIGRGRDGGPVCEWVEAGAAPDGLVLVELATEPGHVAALAWEAGAREAGAREAGAREAGAREAGAREGGPERADAGIARFAYDAGA